MYLSPHFYSVSHCREEDRYIDSLFSSESLDFLSRWGLRMPNFLFKSVRPSLVWGNKYGNSIEAHHLLHLPSRTPPWVRDGMPLGVRGANGSCGSTMDMSGLKGSHYTICWRRGPVVSPTRRHNNWILHPIFIWKWPSMKTLAGSCQGVITVIEASPPSARGPSRYVASRPTQTPWEPIHLASPTNGCHI